MIGDLTTHAWFKANDPNEAVEIDEFVETGNGRMTRFGIKSREGREG